MIRIGRGGGADSHLNFAFGFQINNQFLARINAADIWLILELEKAQSLELDRFIAGTNYDLLSSAASWACKCD